MKVIDLLVRIANEYEIPEKIKYKDYIYWYDKSWKDYKNAQVEYTSYLISCKYHTTDFLNDEVEIIEDTPKKIEYLDDYKIDVRNIDELIDSINLYIELSTNKLNQIIDKINEED